MGDALGAGLTSELLNAALKEKGKGQGREDSQEAGTDGAERHRLELKQHREEDLRTEAQSPLQHRARGPAAAPRTPASTQTS